MSGKRARALVFILLTVACLVLLVAPVFRAPPDFSVASYKNLPEPYVRHNSASAVQQKSSELTECKGLDVPNSYFSSKNLLIPPGRLELNKSIADLIEESRAGKEMSAITLFYLAGSCAPFRDYIKIDNVISEEKMAVKQHTCSTLPAEMTKSPLTALEVAAANGSLKAQILYAENAPVAIRYMAFAFPNESDSVRKEMLNKAERYALAAANLGVAQAYSILLDSYEDGPLAHQDRAKAYAYGFFLAKMDSSPELEEKLRHVYRGLTRDELSRARNLLRPCPSSNEVSMDSLKELL